MTIARTQTLTTIEAALDAVHAAIEEGARLGVSVSAAVVDATLSESEHDGVDPSTHRVDGRRPPSALQGRPRKP